MASYTHPQFRHWADFLEHARDGYSRPVQNNTRVHWAGEDAIAFRLHSTDVVTIHRDGTMQLSTGGWFTITTLDRIRGYSPAHIFTNGGDWLLKGQPLDSDPQPERLARTIPKPYRVPNPGPEPVDDGEGCIAGREEFVPFEDHGLVSDYNEDRIPEHLHRWRQGDHVRYACAGIEHIRWGECAYNNTRWTMPDGEVVRFGGTYKQCPHCRDFQAHHERWRQAMHGDRYAHSLSRQRGYAQMCEMLESFETVEEWQAAYIMEYRAVRENRTELKAWHRRNYVPWHSQIECCWDGYATLAETRKWRRDLKLIEKEERRRARVHAQVERERKRIEAKHAKRRKRELAVRRQVAEALANSLIAELEIARRESFV